MDEGIEKKEELEKNDREEIHSQSVRAGKRTYFFDVKSTRRNDYYLTITESKKRFSREGKSFYEKHKIFLYKEDFEKFIEALNSSVEYINVNAPAIEPLEASTEHHHDEEETVTAGNYTNVNFDDLEEHK
jgi:hypothetical protein